MKSKMNSKMAAPEGGQGWACVLGSFIAHIAYSGSIRAFGVVYLEIIHRYHSNASTAAWIGAIHVTVWGVFGPASTLLSKQFGERLVAMAGGLVLSGGLICAGFAPNLTIVYLGYCVAGIGLSLTFTPGFALIGQHFQKRKALAMSIASVGSGFGTFVLAPLLQLSLNWYGYSGAMLILAGILLNSVVGGALLRPLHQHSKQNKEIFVPDHNSSLSSSKEIQTYKDDQKDSSNGNTAGKMFHLSKLVPHRADGEKSELLARDSSKEYETVRTSTFLLLRNVCFWGMSLINVFSTVSNGVNLGFIFAFAVDRGVEQTLAAFLLSVMTIADVAGRLTSGLVFDLGFIQPVRPYLYAMSVLFLGVSTTVLPKCWSYTSLILVTMMGELFTGVYLSQRATIMADLVGQERSHFAFGFLLLCNAVGHLLGRGIGGVLRDITGSYDMVFYMAGTSSVISALAFLIVLKCFYKPESIP